MKSISINLGKDVKEVELVPISDAHIGDSNANLEELRKIVKYVADKENCYTILNGDLLNTALKNSKSDVYHSMSPMDEMVQIIAELSPIKGKILAVLEGNHERRITRETSIDVSRLIAKELGVEDRYSSGMAYVFLRFGELDKHRHSRSQRYTILATHGSGGGSTVGAKSNRLASLVALADADVYLYGHTHQTIAFKEGFLRVDPCNDSVKMVDRLFVNSCAFLDWGGYAEQNQYRVSTISVPHIHLSGNERKMWVEM